MKVLDWLKDSIVANKLLCEEYVQLVNNAKSKKQLFEICSDANGVSFLCEMRAKGYPLSYDTIKEEFGNYINGNCIVEHESGYTSAIYCACSDKNNVRVETTVACFLGCDLDVHFAPFLVSRICVDENCHLKIKVPTHCKVTVEYWGDDSTIEVIEGAERVKLVKMGK